MLGIENIGVYIPSDSIDNNLAVYNGELASESFIKNKIGVLHKAKISPEQETSDMCVEAVKDLLLKSQISCDEVQCICVCTQNGDYTLPHTSAIVHSKLGLNHECAFFDISLGCSGYVYGLKILEGFMQANNFSAGILVTCDPYSKIIDRNDKNTDLLFGDAATATLLSAKGKYVLGKSVYDSQSNMYDCLIKKSDQYLFMDGRKIFNFAMKTIPKTVCKCLQVNDINNVDLVILHHASRYVVEALDRKLRGILPDGVHAEWDMDNCGNTVSSSIPLELAKKLANGCDVENILLCGFGVGLSAAGIILQKRGCE